jgi:hypothetical protein
MTLNSLYKELRTAKGTSGFSDVCICRRGVHRCCSDLGNFRKRVQTKCSVDAVKTVPFQQLWRGKCYSVSNI